MVGSLSEQFRGRRCHVFVDRRVMSRRAFASLAAASACSAGLALCGCGAGDGSTALSERRSRASSLDVARALQRVSPDGAIPAYRRPEDRSFLNVEAQRSDHVTDAAFVNFREVTAGAIQPGRLFRSASPIGSEYGPYADALLRRYGIGHVLNLYCKSAADVEGRLYDESRGAVRYRSLYESGAVTWYGIRDAIDFGYDNARRYAAAVREICAGEGPYLVHCRVGRDRTGMLVEMLEALCGATWSEMKDDFMESFANINLVTERDDRDAYWTIVEDLFVGRTRVLTNVDGGDPFCAADIAASARAFLKLGGCTDGDLEAAVRYLTSD